LGGYGKTSLALKYANMCRENYNIIWKIRSQRETIRRDCLDLVKCLIRNDSKGNIENAPEKQVINYLKKYLQNNQIRWLLIFDDSQELDEIREYIPDTCSGKGHILITSQDTSSWLHIVNEHRIINLPPLLEKDSVNLITSIIKNFEDSKSASELAAELGYIPLAIVQAVFYIRRENIDITKYLQEFKEFRLEELLTDEDKIKGSEYPYTIAKTWGLTLQKITSKSKILLNLLVLLASEKIPLELFRDENLIKYNFFSNKHLNSKIDINKGIRELLDYSLLQGYKNNYNIHRLVQKFTILKMSEKERIEFLKVCLNLFYQAWEFRYNQDKSWENCQNYVPHIISLFDHIKDFKVAFDDNNDLINDIFLRKEIGRIILYLSPARLADAENYIRESIYKSEELITANNLFCKKPDKQFV
jgi:hypothetical protein